jgi:hypothetical protein
VRLGRPKQSARSTKPRRAARLRTPSVPVTSNPLPSAAAVPLRSSMRMRSACNDSASVIALVLWLPTIGARHLRSLQPVLSPPTPEDRQPSHEPKREPRDGRVPGARRRAQIPFQTIGARGRFDQWTVGKKWGWCQPLPGASKAQAFKAPAFTFRVFPCVLNPYIMGLEKLV